MSHAAAALPPADRIDAKRIVATSGAIAVHVAILMMLMMPPAMKQAETQEEVTVPIWDPPKVLPPPPPPPPPIPRTQVLHQATVPERVSPPNPPVDPVEDTTRFNDIAAPPVPETPPNSFTTSTATSEFQQLAVLAGPPPVYPRQAIMRGIQGTVMLRIHVDANGKPMEVSIESSSGSRILDEAALKFVKARWTFVPAQSAGQAIDSWGLVPVQFVLQQ